MKNTKSLQGIVALVAALLSLPVLAQGTQDIGPYFGVAAGRGYVREACNIGAPCDRTGSAYGLFGGYQFNRYLSTEVGFHWLGDSQIAGATVSSSAAELVGVFAIPIGRVSPYGKLGIFRGQMRGAAQQETNTNVTFGGGLQYNFDSWALRAEYQYYREMGGTNVGGETAIDRASLGIVFKFR